LRISDKQFFAVIGEPHRGPAEWRGKPARRLCSAARPDDGLFQRPRAARAATAATVPRQLWRCFRSRRVDAVFCSTACRHRAYRQRKAAKATAARQAADLAASLIG
jgi:hypothetical protein